MHQFEVAFEWLGAWGISIKVARKVCEEGVLFPYKKKDHEEEENDRVVWMDSKKGFFSVKYLYSILELVCIILFPLGIIWNSWVPPKMSIFWLSKVTSKRCWPWILFKREWLFANMSSLQKWRKINWSHPFTLCQSKGIIEVVVLTFGIVLVLPFMVRKSLQVGMVLLREETARRFGESLLYVFFWGNLEGKWGATDSIAKLLFLRSLVS